METVGYPLLFSARRGQTRYWRDWSSDVCSSDLGEERQAHGPWVLFRLRAQGAQQAAEGVVFRGEQAAHLGPPTVVDRGAELGGASARRQAKPADHRSEDRRVGKACRSRWSPYA